MEKTDTYSQTSGLPCGRCAAGVYDPHPFVFGLARYGNCKSKKEAMRIAPMCEVNSKSLCKGARDFINSISFPMSNDDLNKIIKDILK